MFNYHFYIGNIKAGLSDLTVAQILRAIHPAVLSVRLVPQEVLSFSPLYFDSKNGSDQLIDSVERDLLSTLSSNFYCVKPQHQLKRIRVDQSTDNKELFGVQHSSDSCSGNQVKTAIPVATKKRHTGDEINRQWGCGFIRIQYEGNGWKSILKQLREKINGEVWKGRLELRFNDVDMVY